MDLENTDNLNTGTVCMTWKIETQKQNCQVEMTLVFQKDHHPKDARCFIYKALSQR